MRIQLVQEFGSPTELAGLVKVQEPLLHGRSVLERIGIGAGVDEAFDGFIIVKVHISLAQKTQFSSGFGKSENCDGISVDVAQPAHVGFGLDLKKRTLNVDVVSLARPQQRAVGAECDGSVVVIRRLVGNSDPFHKWGGKSGSLNDQCAVKSRESPVREIRKAP